MNPYDPDHIAPDTPVTTKNALCGAFWALVMVACLAVAACFVWML